jgi:hypothetical protein
VLHHLEHALLVVGAAAAEVRLSATAGDEAKTQVS